MNKLPKALALSVAIALAGCAEDDPQQFIQQGKALIEKGEIKSARVQFKNALQINPQLPEAYYNQALLDEMEKKWPAMTANLQDVLRLAPGHVDAQVKLGFLLINDLDKAREMSVAALKLEPENVDALLLKGHILYSEKNYAEAISLAEKVLSIKPGKNEAYWLKATILIKEKQDDKAVVVLRDGLKMQPGNVDLGLLKIRLHMRNDEVESALREYDALIAHNPNDKNLYISRINVMSKHGKKDLVESYIAKAMEVFPDDEGLGIARVDYLLGIDVVKAEALLQKNISEYPQSVHFKSRLAELYVAQKKYPEALQVYKELAAIDSLGEDGLAAKVWQAKIALIQEDDKLAQLLLDEVLVTDANNINALLLRADIRLSKKGVDGAIADLRIVLRDKPESENALLLMARAHSLKGELEVAETYWRKVLEINPENVVAIVPLNSRLLQRGNLSGAEGVLNKAIKAKPDSQVLHELLVKLKFYGKDWNAAEIALNAMEKQTKSELAVQTLRAELAEKQGDFNKAVRVYQNILNEEPKSMNVLVAMAHAYDAMGDRSAYITFLLGFIEQNPGAVNAYNELGRMYALEKKWDLAEKFLQKVLQQDEQTISTYKLLAGVMERQGKSDGIIELYNTGLTKSPGNPFLTVELAKYQASIGKTQEARLLYERLLEKNPGFDEAANNLTEILLSKNSDQVTLERALSLTKHFKDSRNPYFLDTYGWVLFKVGELDNALVALKQSAKALPDNADIRYHLGEALYAKGDYSASKVELEKSLLLVQKSGEFSGIERARLLLKEIGVSTQG